MRIAFFHELLFGGARRVVEEYAKRLEKKHVVDLYYVDEKEDKNVLQYFNNVFYYQFYSNRGTGLNRFYKDTLELFRLYLVHRNIASLINGKNYEFVLVYPSKFTQAPFIIQFLKARTIYFCQEPLRIVHDGFLLEDVKYLPFVKKYYEKANRFVRKQVDRANINEADVILANSRFSQNWIKRAYKKDSKVCYLGVDVKKFRPTRKKKAYDLLFIGQKDKIEGYDLLEDTLKVFSKKPKVKIIQRNDKGQGIEDLELVEEYNKAKIVLCLSRNEPFGLISIEAQSCGVPVVAVNEGGFSESVIDGKTGFLVKRDSKNLYVRINELLNDESLRIKLGHQAREYIKSKWTWEQSLQSLENIIYK